MVNPNSLLIEVVILMLVLGAEGLFAAGSGQLPALAERLLAELPSEVEEV